MQKEVVLSYLRTPIKTCQYAIANKIDKDLTPPELINLIQKGKPKEKITKFDVLKKKTNEKLRNIMNKPFGRKTLNLVSRVLKAKRDFVRDFKENVKVEDMKYTFFN